MAKTCEVWELKELHVHVHVDEYKWADRPTERQKHIVNTHTDIQMNRQTDRQAGRQAGRWMDRQVDRQTDTQTHTHTHTDRT